MKVSKEKKKEIRSDLIKAAVELFSEKDFNIATMKEISTRAGYGAATIYNYFPTKEAIFYAYFDEKQNELGALLDGIEEFGQYTLKEKLQAQLESLLEIYLPDREFVQKTYKTILDSPMKNFTELAPAKEKFVNRAGEFFADAVNSGEIQGQPFERFLTHLYWDYASLVIFYWLKDTSSGFDNTSRLIDLSLDIFVDIIKSDLFSKTADLLMFLLKSHLFGNIDRIFEVFSLIGYSGKGR